MDLQAIDRLILNVRTSLDYQKYMTPFNYAEENKRFMECYRAGIIYNPQYRYETFSPNREHAEILSACIDETSKMPGGIAKILHAAALNLQKEIVLYTLIGNDDEFSSCCNSVYGTPDLRLTDTAFQMLKALPTDTVGTPVVSAKKLGNILAKRLKLYGFDWKITLSPHMASRVSVEPEQKTIYINESKTFSEKDVLKLQTHEIDTHVLRCENGLRRGFSIFSSGTAGALIHEEGLASFSEEKNKVQDAHTLKLYAARFLTCCNIKNSFFVLFDELVRLGCDTEQAMYVTARIKRGLSDTSKPGGFIKDYVYFQGYHEVKEFIEQNPNLYPYLYYGSISTHDITLLRNEIEREYQANTILLPPFLK